MVDTTPVTWHLYDVDGWHVGTIELPRWMPMPHEGHFPQLVNIPLGSPPALLVPRDSERWGTTPPPVRQVATSIANQLLGIFISVPFVQLNIKIK